MAYIQQGRYVAATPDGRLAWTPLTNANSPSAGSDRKGLTALLNSLVKLVPIGTAGQVQYLKLNRELFTTGRPQLEALLRTYFAQGGFHAMVTVVSRDDLENAVREPDKYQNLIVRVGGFSARFVTLAPELQQDIIARMLQ